MQFSHSESTLERDCGGGKWRREEIEKGERGGIDKGEIYIKKSRGKEREDTEVLT